MGPNEMGYPDFESAEFQENEDGSVDILPVGEDDESQPESFEDNLVDILDPSVVSVAKTRLLELVEIDKESRKKRDEQYAEGMRRTGLAEEKPSGASFQGASDVVHPVLAEACIDYSASVMKELFPPDGPVKTKFRSNSPDATQTQRAENRRDFYNWQLTTQIVEYRSNLETLTIQQPLGGSQFLKFWWDNSKNRPCCEFIPIDQIYLPFSANSFYTSPRMTVELRLTRQEFQRRISIGMYSAKADLPSPAFTPDESDAQKVSDSIEGVTDDAYNEDGVRVLYEIYAEYDFETPGENLPYIITIDDSSNEVVAIYRNWDEEDFLKEKLDWVIEFPFLPWRGAYGIGLYHLIGGLAASATGALRALLDSAHINNFPGALRLKGTGRNAGQTIQLNPTEIAEIDSVAGVDDIRKIVMGLPYNAPSPVLFQLMEYVVQAAKGCVSVAEEKIADAGNNMPVGTALALIEQGSKVFSSIHARQHHAQERVLRVLSRLNYENYDPQIQVKAFNRVLVTQEEFKESGNISPVSDPNIYSEAQRYAQIQGVLQLSADPSVPWNKVAIYRRMLSVMHVDNPDELLPNQPQPVSADPVTEVVAAMSGQQLKALPEMDHLVHINEELAFLMDPLFGAANPTLVNPGFQMIVADINQHLILLFQTLKQKSQQDAVMKFQEEILKNIPPDVSPEIAQSYLQQMASDPQVRTQIQAQANMAYKGYSDALQTLLPMIQQANELVKQRTPPPPVPPEVQAQIQIAQMANQRQSQVDQATIQMKGQAQQQDQQRKEIELQMAQRQQEFENFMKVQSDRMSHIMDQMAQQVQLQKNDDDNRQHQYTELLKNHEDNQTNVLMEQMRQEGLQNREALKVHLQDQQAKMDQVINLILERIKLEKGGLESTGSKEGME